MKATGIKATKYAENWQGWRDSNPQPSVLETAVLPLELHPCRALNYTDERLKVKRF